MMAHGMASGLGCYYRTFDSLVHIDGGRRILAFDWLGMVSPYAQGGDVTPPV